MNINGLSVYMELPSRVTNYKSRVISNRSLVGLPLRICSTSEAGENKKK